MPQLFYTEDDKLYKRRKNIDRSCKKLSSLSNRSHVNDYSFMRRHKHQICFKCERDDKSNKNKLTYNNKNTIQSKIPIQNYLNTVLFIVASIFCAWAFMTVISFPYNIILSVLMLIPLATNTYRMVRRHNERSL